MSDMFSISNYMFGTLIPFLLCVYGIEKVLLCIGWRQLSDNQQVFILNCTGLRGKVPGAQLCPIILQLRPIYNKQFQVEMLYNLGIGELGLYISYYNVCSKTLHQFCTHGT